MKFSIKDFWKKNFYMDKLHMVFASVTLLLFLLLGGFALFYTGMNAASMAILAAFAVLSVLLVFFKRPLPKAVDIILALVTPVIAFLLLESLTHSPYKDMSQDAVNINLIFYYLVYLLLFAAIGRLKAALITATLLFALIGVANYYVILFRSIPILPWDLFALKTAATVADNYVFTIDWPLACKLGGFLLLLCVNKTNHIRVKHIAVRIVSFAIFCIPMSFWVNLTFQPDLAERYDLDNTLFTPKFMYKTNGFFTAFFMDLRHLQIDAPDGYSREAVANILSGYEEESTLPDKQDMPNIIVIMNEAFSDPAVLGDFETNMPYMPFIQSLLDGAENTISGYLFVSPLGGNTPNSEYEFLTGNTMSYLPTGSVPYQMFIQSETDSIASLLKSYGYDTVAMHPYNSTGWNRNTVYPLLGFDDMFFINDFQNRTKLRKYVSDEADYKEIARIFEEHDEPLFLLNVTMQNHSGYGDAFDNFTPEVEVTTSTNKYLNTYLSLIKKSDEAVKQLLTYLSDCGEDTIVVFYGDHQTNEYVITPIYKDNQIDKDNLTLKQEQDRQMVPYFIWANYDIEEKSGFNTSTNYLGTMLMEVAGLPKSAYQNFLTSLQEVLPVINARGIVTADGEYRELDDTAGYEDLLRDYDILQYYHLFDRE